MTEKEKRRLIFAAGFIAGAAFMTSRLNKYVTIVQDYNTFVTQHFEAASDYIQGMHDDASDPVKVREKYLIDVAFLNQVYE